MKLEDSIGIKSRKYIYLMYKILYVYNADNFILGSIIFLKQYNILDAAQIIFKKITGKLL